MFSDQENKTAFSHLCRLWMQTMNKMNEFETSPADFGTGMLLYPSEIHTVQAIGDMPGMNVTELSERMGVTRGAASQMVTRLAGKDLIEKFRLPDNEKEVRLRLTNLGKIACKGHEERHGWINRRIFERIGNRTEDEYAFLNEVFSAINEVTDEMLTKTQLQIKNPDGEGLEY